MVNDGANSLCALPKQQALQKLKVLLLEKVSYKYS